jgi:hypothetical protein
MKSYLHSQILSCHYSASCQLRRLPQFYAAAANSGTQLNSHSSCVRSSLYSLGVAPTENTASSIVACWFTAGEMCLPHRCLATSAAWTIVVRVRFRGKVVTEPLPSNELFRLSGVMSQCKYKKSPMPFIRSWILVLKCHKAHSFIDKYLYENVTKWHTLLNISIKASQNGMRSNIEKDKAYSCTVECRYQNIT